MVDNIANFIQVVEDLNEVLLGATENETVYLYLGKQSKKLYGFKIVPNGGEKIKTIWLSDIERMKQIIDQMTGG